MKTPLGETFEAKPESLAVVNEEFESRAGTIAKDEQRAGEWVLIETRLAKGDERVNAFAEIYRLVSEQDFELRDELNHRDFKRAGNPRRVALWKPDRARAVSV